MRSHALGTPSRSCVRSVFCWPAFPSACPLPSISSARGASLSLGPLGSPWPFPAFPPSCPFRSAICPLLQRRRSLFGDFVGTTGPSDSLLRASVDCVLGLPTAARG